MQNILKDEYGARPKPSIYTSKFLRTRHCVDRVQDQSTVMDYLVTRGTVEEATIVFNFLVDVCAIEAVVVCKTQAEAKTISTFAKDVPRYMRKAITLDLYEFIPPPGYKTRYLNPVRNRVIGYDSSQAMDENEREVQHEIKTLKEISSKIETLKKEEDALKGEIIQVRRRKSRMSQELQKIDSELTEMVSEPEISSDLEELKATHAKKREQLDSISRREKELQEIIDQMSEDLDTKKKLHNDKKMKLSQAKESFSWPHEKQLTELEELLKNKTKYRANQEKIKLNHKKILHDLNVDLEKIESRCTNERKVAESRTNGCVLNPSLTLSQITAKLRRVQEQKKRNPTEVARRQRDDILKVYQERQSLFRVQKSNLDSLRKLSTKMEESNCRRKDHFVIIRKFVSKRVRRQFNHDSEKFSQEV